MRKLFYLLGLMALITAMPLKSTAQEFHFMPKIGFTLADISTLEANVRSGVNVGIGVEYLSPTRSRQSRLASITPCKVPTLKIM